jgi:thiosulfate dehydrogenase (quinone) large subunit
MKTELQSRNDNRVAVMNSSVVARKITCSVGILYGFFVWSVAEGFGGPYRPGTTTDVGAAIIYSLLFGALLLFDAGRYSVDRWIERWHVAWRKVAELRS